MNRKESIVSAIAVLAVAIAGVFGLKVDVSALTDVLSALALLGAYAWCTWKNHNFTQEALEAQAFLNISKATVPRNIYGVEDEEEL